MTDEKREARSKRDLDRELDRQLEDTFPASDPTEITRRRSIAPEPPAEADDRSAKNK